MEQSYNYRAFEWRMAMLFATKYPERAQNISLDHRRMIMPRCSSPKIYTLRGSDYEADENVIPTTEEQEKYHITVIKLDEIKHGDMDNKGTNFHTFIPAFRACEC